MGAGLDDVLSHKLLFPELRDEMVAGLDDILTGEGGVVKILKKDMETNANLKLFQDGLAFIKEKGTNVRILQTCSSSRTV
jgi:hypothetical protein